MQSDAIGGNQRQSVALIFNHLLSESIGGNQIASETMREAIGGTMVNARISRMRTQSPRVGL